VRSERGSGLTVGRTKWKREPRLRWGEKRSRAARR